MFPLNTGEPNRLRLAGGVPAAPTPARRARRGSPRAYRWWRPRGRHRRRVARRPLEDDLGPVEGSPRRLGALDDVGPGRIRGGEVGRDAIGEGHDAYPGVTVITSPASPLIIVASRPLPDRSRMPSATVGSSSGPIR